MKNLTLDKIEIQNFKGIASLQHKFSKITTRIYGENGSGKSTLKNAWEWCLCQNVEDYLPMINNKEIPDLVTSVSVYISVGDIEYKLTRESRPKYSSTRGRSNELTYKIDDIELTKASYTEKISQILGANTFENIPILTDKDFFNSDSTKWKWNNRRELLLSKCNIEEESKSLINSGDYDTIKPYILKGFQTSEIQSTLLKEKKDLRKRQEENSIRSESKAKEIHDYLGIDFEAISKELSATKTKLTKLTNASEKSAKVKAISNRIEEISIEIDRLKTADALALKEEKSKLVKLFDKAYDWKCDYENKLTVYNKCIDEIEDNVCPHCKKPLFDKAEMESKKDVLFEMLEKSKAEKDKAEKLYNEQHDKVENFTPNPRIIELENTEDDLKLQLEDIEKQNSNKLMEEEKTRLLDTISRLENEMAKRQFIDKITQQLKSWSNESRDIADKIIEVENKEIELQNFVKAQTELITKIVNDKFDNGISWSLFSENYNGTIDQDCICLYNGKRYSSLSTGEKNKANMEVVKTLQKMFDVELPIFSDNAETTTLPYEAKSQVIELYASIPTNLQTQTFETLKATKITDLYS